MSNRRNFLAVMVGTASLGVLSNLGKGVINPSYAQNPSCTVDNATTRAAVEGGFVVLSVMIGLFKDLIGVTGSGSASQISGLAGKLRGATNDKASFWSNPSKIISFVKGSVGIEQTKAAQALKGKFTSKQVQTSVEKALGNLKANNISAIENDPIIGPVVKAGYNGAVKKLKEAAARQSEIEALRRDLRNKMAIRVEAEALKLKKESKLTNRDLQELSRRYPSLAPRLQKAIDLNVQIKTPSGIPVTPGLKEQQLKSNATSISNQNRFDTYAQIFESRLLAVPTPINGEDNLTLADKLLGIEKANACELFCVSIILIIAVAAAVAAAAAAAAVSDAVKNEVCRELTLKLEQAAAVAACEERAGQRRRERLAARDAEIAACKKDWGIFCVIGDFLFGDDIEGDYERDVDACT
jgi:hypothetical protein